MVNLFLTKPVFQKSILFFVVNNKINAYRDLNINNTFVLRLLKDDIFKTFVYYFYL